MNTKDHRNLKSIILQALYFKLRFTLRYRDVEEIMKIRGVNVDHTKTQRCVYKFIPLIELDMKKIKVFTNAQDPKSFLPRFCQEI